MFSKLSLSLVLIASLACVGQVTTTGGYGTTYNVASTPAGTPDAPIISTPDIALPGSGPAVGAPLTNVNTNDSRTATRPSVYNPNFISPVSGNPQEASFTGSAPASGNEGFEFGVQHFVSGAPAAATSRQSLAEIARAIKAQHPKASRSFNNDSIARLNAEGVRTGNLGPESSAASTELAKAPAQNTLVAENRMPALPQSDQPATAPTRQNSATAAQQRHKDQALTERQSAPPAPAQASAPVENAQNTAKLPQTSSALPIILLLGALGIAGGALFYFMRR